MDMLEEMQPDVVMTDIRMPYMDGLELCAHIKAKYPATKILLFTGFDDFEYAKEAVHLEIEEYILKPLNAVEITEVFERLKEKLDYEISEKRNTDLLKKYYADSLPMLQANLYTTLIEEMCIRDRGETTAVAHRQAIKGEALLPQLSQTRINLWYGLTVSRQTVPQESLI